MSKKFYKENTFAHNKTVNKFYFYNFKYKKIFF